MKTVEEVASYFKVHFRTVYYWIKNGKINAVKVGRRHYITQEEIDYIKKNGLRNATENP
jgi:excisionase family DNA binding protein